MIRRSDHREGAPLVAWGETLRAAKARRRTLRLRGAGIALGTMVLAGTIVWPPVPRLVWNASASAPIGLYAVSPDAVIAQGDMVIARLPADMRRLASARRYLPENVPLVKRVAAIAGDEICALGPTVFRDGWPVAIRKVADARGRAMPWWQGCHVLRGPETFLLMDARDSFDGRYTGITSGADLVGRAQLVWKR